MFNPSAKPNRLILRLINYSRLTYHSLSLLWAGRRARSVHVLLAPVRPRLPLTTKMSHFVDNYFTQIATSKGKRPRTQNDIVSSCESITVCYKEGGIRRTGRGKRVRTGIRRGAATAPHAAKSALPRGGMRILATEHLKLLLQYAASLHRLSSTCILRVNLGRAPNLRKPAQAGFVCEERLQPSERIAQRVFLLVPFPRSLLSCHLAPARRLHLATHPPARSAIV